ncbi:Zinc transporter SLC39A7 [Zancudomyces culisetae]|uniref:Zinc transporter SLC39A7 n=1 Tax=Zancudomyces culisetae TaxID=1213189 RepID=A0A1R1PZ54_ZANCU|nr:Zinc transporter SLC39A7 [Zancudomyces culisetae]|eukprot:OMH86226.1 Zinc transporter SLC39A7 [Zancudomyces culisetae]
MKDSIKSPATFFIFLLFFIFQLGNIEAHAPPKQNKGGKNVDKFWEGQLVVELIDASISNAKEKSKIREFIDTSVREECVGADSCPVYARIRSVLEKKDISEEAKVEELLENLKQTKIAALRTGDHHHHHHHGHNTFLGKLKNMSEVVGNILFDSENPAKSSILATFYISLFPNLVLLVVPKNLSERSLRLMVSFAIGGLLGDVFFHLLPHIFHGESHSDSHGHGDEAVRNTVLGLGIFFGLLTFMVVDKTMRLFGEEGHSHSHGHSHGHSHSHGNSSSVKAQNPDEQSSLKQRKPNTPKKSGEPSTQSEETKSEKQKQVQYSAYMNLIADASHNFTDGLALSASFYVSPAAGLSTFVAVFMHEIPHELGDFAILIQSGFSQFEALMSQFVTAIGAMTGAVAGVVIEEYGRGNSLNFNNLITFSGPVFTPVPVSTQASSTATQSLLFKYISTWVPKTIGGVSWSELLIPFTAGGFIYIATVGVIPDLLNPITNSTHKKHKKGKNGTGDRKTVIAIQEVLMMVFGAVLMAIISLSE